MKPVGVAELKARLSEYLARVQAGEQILVSDRGRLVARLVPFVPDSADEEDAHLRDLERQGLITRGSGRVPAAFWEVESPPDPEDGVLRAVLEEREEGW
jgi:prevent-host-death family protein